MALHSASHPLYTPAEARSRETFLALMWALSYPGRVYTLPDTASAFESISETLLDLETTYYTPDWELARILGHNGARALPPESAAYHFYPTFTDTDFAALREANVGTLLYPDRSATIFVGCTLDTHEGEILSLTGPGIPGNITVGVGGLPQEFWTLRDQQRRFPLGWDIYLIDHLRVMGIPRSTTLTR